MPKESSHLYLAGKVANQIKNKNIKKIIKNNFYFYQIGSFSPDIFSYGKKLAITKISRNIHGDKEEKTNKIIFEMLDKIDKGDEKNLAFIFGFLTHLAVDITFHPLVYYFTGKAGISKIALYRHIAFETSLDKFFHSKFIIPFPSFEKINQLVFLNILEKEYQMSKKELAKNYQRQYWYNQLFRNKLAYWILKILNKLRLFNQFDKLGLFYANSLYSKQYFSQNFNYRDPINGKAINTNINKLAKKATELASQYIQTAFSYYLKKINREEAEKNIDGKNLSTGKISLKANEMKFFDKNVLD